MLPHLILHILFIIDILSTLLGLEYTSTTNLSRQCTNETAKADDIIAFNGGAAPCSFYKTYPSQTTKLQNLNPKRSEQGTNGIFNFKIDFIPQHHSKASDGGEDIIYSNDSACKIVITYHSPPLNGQDVKLETENSEITVPCGGLRYSSSLLSNAIESISDRADDKITLYEKDILSFPGGILTIRGFNLPSVSSEMGGGTFQLIVSFIPGSENKITQASPILSRKKRQTYGYPTQRYYTSYNPYDNYNTNYRTTLPDNVLTEEDEDNSMGISGSPITIRIRSTIPSIHYGPSSSTLYTPIYEIYERSRAGSIARIGGGIIAAIVICCLICCGLATGLCFYCCCRGGRASQNLPAWARGMPAIYRTNEPAPTHSGRGPGEAYDPAPQQAYPVYPKLDQNYGGQAYPVGSGGTAYYQGYPQARTENDPPGYTPSAPVGYPQGGR